MHRPLILYLAASLDGFIARPDGAVDWLDNPDLHVAGEDFGYAEFYSEIDTTLMGWKTYQAVLDMGVPFPYPDKENYVCSRHQRPEQEHVKVVGGDLVAFLDQMKKRPGKGIWLVGGANLNTFLLEAGLIDRIILTLAPVLLGSGIPLFESYSTDRLLNLQKVRSWEKGWVQLTYDL